MKSLSAFCLFTFFITSFAFSANQTPPKKAKNADQNIHFFKSPKFSDRFQKLVFNHRYTFIPKGVIVYLPPQHKSKISSSSGDAKLVSLKEFLAQNRSWIYTISLSKAQAFPKKGKVYEFPYQKLEDLKKVGRVIICTYNGAPVPVKIQKNPNKK